MSLKLLNTFTILLMAVQSFSQQVKFQQSWLDNPAKYSTEIEEVFTSDTIDTFQKEEYKSFTILENGYAKSKIKNTNDWKGIPSEYYADTIIFIYTQYPKNINFWLTNYHTLLAQRLKNLFKLSPDLNSEQTKFKILLQTSCNTDDEAKKMFHGIAIHLAPIISEPVKQQENIIKQQVYDDTLKNIKNSEQHTITTRKINSFIANNGGITDSVVYKIFSRHPEWDNCLVIMDWTGSMYPYGAQAVLWHSLNLKQSGIKYFVFFNDGNMEKRKKIGKTRGVYFEKAENINKIIGLLSKVKAKGNGGDPEENDVEAILKGIQKYPDFKNLILIADNNSCMRDYCLVKDIKVPVKVVLCGTYSGINPQYINLAYKTKGSIHTIEDDISDFYNRTNTDATFMIDGSEYRYNTKRDLFEYLAKPDKDDPHFCELFYKKRKCKCEKLNY
ncbi:MAG TPA: hypothetical protein PKC85_07925 [Bacteroidia bacterium]|jgi:hypothetical protein|nr:hypothetical protein [Bacteroidia bacterium]